MNTSKYFTSKNFIRQIGMIAIITMMVSVMTACGGNYLSKGTYELVGEDKAYLGNGFKVVNSGEIIAGKDPDAFFWEGVIVPYSLSDGKIHLTDPAFKITRAYDYSVKGDTLIIDGVTYKKK